MSRINNLNIPEGFITAEERCDYWISDKMKKVWAIQLDLVMELRRVCDKYGLVFYADSGTLLGAIRHKGYIPWDDDIDIAMKREDFEKLIKVAQDEFAEPYFFQEPYSEKGYLRGYARLRNSETTAITKRDLYKNINKGIFIDIFPMDNIPDDEGEFQKWLTKIKKYSAKLSLASVVMEPVRENASLKRRIIAPFGKALVSIIGQKRIYDGYVKLCSRYNERETKRICYVAFSLGRQNTLLKRSDFDKTTNKPFEFIEVPVPEGYASILTQLYGDYMVMKRASSVHGGTILDPDISYKEYFKTHSLESIEKELME